MDYIGAFILIFSFWVGLSFLAKSLFLNALVCLLCFIFGIWVMSLEKA